MADRLLKTPRTLPGSHGDNKTLELRGFAQHHKTRQLETQSQRLFLRCSEALQFGEITWLAGDHVWLALASRTLFAETSN